MPSIRSSQSAFANVAASQTDASAVPAYANKRIRVLAVAIVNGDTAASTVTFNTKPVGAGSAISATFKSGPNALVELSSSDGWFQTNVGEGLSVTTGAGAVTPVAIQVVYTVVS